MELQGIYGTGFCEGFEGLLAGSEIQNVARHAVLNPTNPVKPHVAL